MSLVGTLNRIRKEVPPLVKALQQSRYSSKLLQSKKRQQPSHNLDNLPMQKKKNVCIFSTLHTSVMVNTTTKKKPETVTFYKKTKCGVNIADHMTTTHGKGRYTAVVGSCLLQYFGPCSYQRLRVVQKENWRSILRRNFTFQLATELREDHVQGKTDLLATVLFSLFNNSYQNLMVDKSRKRKQCQVNVNCEQNKIPKLCCGCRISVFGKCIDCIKVECIDCV